MGLPLLQSYVVYLGGHSHGPEVTSFDLERVTDSHYDFLGSCLGSNEKAKDAIFYSYTRYINGFAATLEEEEAESISKNPNVLSVFLNKGRKLHTTRSWNFLGLESNGEIPSYSIWNKARYGEDTIIGNLDTGVWPESQSFNDEGMGPIPTRWKGICQNNTKDGVPCNRKLIGARYFNKGYAAVAGVSNSSNASPRDDDGHGTHTLSTAGGNFVSGASVLGFGNGTAKGGSPKARVAAYKVCWKPINDSSCFDADILAAFDAAIHDGVDVLSVSIGGQVADYFGDGISIGSFHAVKNGIVVVSSAGNSGPMDGSVSNVSPWMLTVGASTIDREFTTYVALGNRTHLKGQSLSPKSLPIQQFYPLISGVDAKAANATVHDAQLCFAGSLDPEKVKGKILACLRGISGRVEKGVVALQAGAVGMILANDASTGNEIIADSHLLPAAHINYTDGLILFAYINSTKSPYAYMTRARTQLGIKPAPFMAAFSSKGPNTITPEILKPDITAPGVSIIAAFSQAVGPAGDTDERRVLFNTESGTSMSCPHISGIAGLLKTLHPDWSPSAIKSAIMTTARTQDNENQAMLNASYIKATPFSYGSGQVRPNGAMDPGLVYDLTTNDYLDFLCGLDYDENQIQLFAGKPYSCPNSYSLIDFNYPSITVPNLDGSITVTRKVKNVGSPSTYHAKAHAPLGITVTVEPKTLTFEKTGEEKTFKVSLKARWAEAATEYVFGKLTWSDGQHYVRSPIVVKKAA
ncbi:Peptidase S8/S53 domain [Macleaya cordata]|uniref:Peptidase S8/S53 domain n=1 Tax=Macleaya cordata TaxID=56857 RepID=A0A200RAI9_MACCD|nr:Peptidase S8/S53 domain [Macleaya cordata]